MTPRGLAVLAGATALAVLAAGTSLGGRWWATHPAAVDAPLVAGLALRVNDVAAIEVRSPGGSATIARSGDAWTLAERGGYPADPAKARDLVLRLAELRTVEAKTADPARLPRLELEDPAGEGAKSFGLRLIDGSGAAIADVVVGKRAYGLFGPGRSGTYVRRAGEDQAWLADGELEVPDGPLQWLERGIVDIPEDRIRRVVLEPPGIAVPVTIERQAGSLQLAPLPEGRSGDPDRLARTAGLLSSLIMQDVKPLAEVDLTRNPGRARYETTDGRTVTLTWVADGAESWARFEVAATAPEATEEAKAAAAADSKRLDGWAFRLSEFITERLQGDIETLLAAPPEG